jgi:hypothetical protein
VWPTGKTRYDKEQAMRAEAQKMTDTIKESLALLRRHL